MIFGLPGFIFKEKFNQSCICLVKYGLFGDYVYNSNTSTGLQEQLLLPKHEV